MAMRGRKARKQTQDKKTKQNPERSDGEKNASWQTLRKLKQRYFKVFGMNEISIKSS